MEVISAVKKLQGLCIKKEHTLQELTEEFYNVCREFNIKQGEPCYGPDGSQVGRTCNTIQWNIVKDAFVKRVNHYFLLWDIIEDPPSDIA